MSQMIKRIIIKSPLIPLCPVFDGGKDYQSGKPLFPPFGKGRSGGILRKYYVISNFYIFQSLS